MNKWVGYEYVQARAIAVSNNEKINRLEHELVKLYNKSFEIIGLIYKCFHGSRPS